jgi:hypothetical protein
VIAIVGGMMLAGAGTNLVLMLVLQQTITGEGGGPDVPREEDPARFERNFFASAFIAAAGAILLLIAAT